MWSISRVPFLTVSVSASGLLSLTLSGLLPAPVFLVLAGLHLWVALNFERVLPVSTRQVMLFTSLFFLVEIFRMLIQGSGVIPYCLRDIIVCFAVLRLILPKTGREIYQIVAIGLAQCMLSTIFTLSPLFLIGLVLMGVLVPMTLSALDEEDFGQASGSRAGFLHWFSVYSGIVISTCILFFLIPRPSSTIVRYALESQGKRSFSGETDLARKADIDEDRQIVMRIFWDRGQAPGLFYLSGSRLDVLTDDGFTRGREESSPFLPSRVRTDHLTIYQTELEALNVFYPFRISDISPPTVSLKGLNLYWHRANPLVYGVWADRSGDPSPPRPGPFVPQALQGVASLGRSVAGGSRPDAAAEKLVEYLDRTCSYTLEGLRIPSGVSPIPWFLMSGKRGSCEHFASALAVMLRGCGIPSRVVTGFMVHEFNSTGGYYVVRASDAHAWVEYYHQGSWRTCEATPKSLSAIGPESSIVDAFRFAWIRWVIRYSLNDQIHLALKLSSAPAELEHRVVFVLGLSFCAAGLVLLLWFLAAGTKKGNAGLYGRVVRAFGKKGLRLAASGSHEEHLEQVAREWPLMAGSFRTYLDAYLSWRFGSGHADIGDATARMVDEIRKSRVPHEGIPR